MQALVEHSRATDAVYRIATVISDEPGAPGLALAQGLGIATRAVPVQAAAKGAVVKGAVVSDLGGYEASLAAAIDECSPALIVLAGFMRILSAEFVERYAGRILNVHPSLLPKYPGLHTHRKAITAGDSVHGATVHFVTPKLDGGPAIIQARIGIVPGEAEHSLAARVLTLEHHIYPLAVSWYCEGRLQYRCSRAWLDGEALPGPVLWDVAAGAPAGPRGAQGCAACE